MLFELRLTVDDRPGSLARLTALLAELKIDVREIDFLGSVIGQAVDNLLIECSQAQLDAVQAALPGLHGFTLLSARQSTRTPGLMPEFDLLLAVARAPAGTLDEFTKQAARVFAADWAMTFAIDSSRARWQSAQAPEALRVGRFPTRATRVLPGSSQYSLTPNVLTEMAHTPVGSDHVLLLGRTPGPTFHELELLRVNRVVEVAAALLPARNPARL